MHPDGRQGEGSNADRKVHEENPAPGKTTGQGAAEQRSDRHGDARHATPDAEGGSPVLAAERVSEQRKRPPEHDGSADALDRPGYLQKKMIGGKSAEHRRGSENDESDAVEQFSAVHVCE